MVALFDHIMRASDRVHERALAEIKASTQSAIEAERSRCDFALRRDRDYFDAQRKAEERTRAEVERRWMAEQARIAEASSELADTRDELQGEIAELARQLQQPQKPGEPSPFEKFAPLLEKFGPVLLPKVMEWLGGGHGAPHGSLPGNGAAGA